MTYDPVVCAWGWVCVAMSSVSATKDGHGPSNEWCGSRTIHGQAVCVCACVDMWRRSKGQRRVEWTDRPRGLCGCASRTSTVPPRPCALSAGQRGGQPRGRDVCGSVSLKIIQTARCCQRREVHTQAWYLERVNERMGGTTARAFGAPPHTHHELAHSSGPSNAPTAHC
jgi:hypothetical protein